MGASITRTSLVTIVLALLASTAAAQSQRVSTGSPDTREAAARQQFASCEADADAIDIHGDARKSYMSTCLSRRLDLANTDAAREKFKSCTAQGAEKNMAEAPRKAFVENCIKGFVL